MPRSAIPIRLITATALLAAASAHAADRILVCDVQNDRVMLFDAADGAILDANWLTDAAAVGWAFTTPVEAIRVGAEYWVSDLDLNRIFRFDLQRTFLGAIDTAGPVALNDPRGMALAADRVYVSTTPPGPGAVIISYAFDGSYLGAHVALSGANSIAPDVELFAGGLLLPHGQPNWVYLHDLSGGGPAPFAPIIVGRQITRLADDSVLIVSAPDGLPSAGLYHLEPDGAQRAFIPAATMTLRGGALLDDGGYFLTGSDGVHKAAPTGGGAFTVSPVASGMFCYHATRFSDALSPDLDGDGLVGASDLALMLGAWGQSNISADLDGGGVGSSDLALLLGAWGG